MDSTLLDLNMHIQEPTDHGAVFLADVEMSKLGEVAPRTTEEILISIRHLKPATTPGSKGILDEFYQTYADTLADRLLEVPPAPNLIKHYRVRERALSSRPFSENEHTRCLGRRCLRYTRGVYTEGYRTGSRVQGTNPQPGGRRYGPQRRPFPPQYKSHRYSSLPHPAKEAGPLTPRGAPVTALPGSRRWKRRPLRTGSPITRSNGGREGGGGNKGRTRLPQSVVYF
ncbi:hypothetical protein NDU88_000896 [Pleurodeles waltl]|uniref:Uncharacterized protein n=1 Tax=Pleurodeles waltl TaxID=8319 RepID=A0AAV7Q2H0_PLEWA|nr:hypothetical protein NDU88_000896 [Pleurodeles waltl]